MSTIVEESGEVITDVKSAVRIGGHDRRRLIDNNTDDDTNGNEIGEWENAPLITLFVL